MLFLMYVSSFSFDLGSVTDLELVDEGDDVVRQRIIKH